MAWFSRFDGDDNEELFFLQRSVWFGEGSGFVSYFSTSIYRYKNYSDALWFGDDIIRALNKRIVFRWFLYGPFIEIVSAYYRYIWGLQYRIPYPNFGVPRTDNEWLTHFKKFLDHEAEKISENTDFFPSIIHLIVCQDLPYAIHLQKHLLLIINKIYSEKIKEQFQKDIQFIRKNKLEDLQKHEINFEEFYRSQILDLLKKQEKIN